MQNTDCRCEIRKEIVKENNYFIQNRKGNPEETTRVLELGFSNTDDNWTRRVANTPENAVIGSTGDCPPCHAYAMTLAHYTLPRVSVLSHCCPEEKAERLDVCLVVCFLFLNHSKAFSITSIFFIFLDCICSLDASVIKGRLYKIRTFH